MGTASAATGVIAMVLLTAVVVLGISVNRRVRLPGLPRHSTLGLHRFVALLAVGFLAIHILTAVLAPFARIGPAVIFIPFAARYESAWLALGAVASDLIMALVVTSLLRRHIGRRSWRAVHWLAYACWPAALAHGIGSGPGMRTGRLLDVALGCVAVVGATVAWRLAAALRAQPGRRRAAPVSAAVIARAPPREPAGNSAPSDQRLQLDPVACTGHGLCADLLPELITLDPWGYPLVAGQPVPTGLARRARRAVTDCPVLALRLIAVDSDTV